MGNHFKLGLFFPPLNMWIISPQKLSQGRSLFKSWLKGLDNKEHKEL